MEFWRTASAFVSFALLAFTLATRSFAATTEREIPSAFGPHVNLKPADFAEAKTHLHWSYEDLPPLVQAREELLRAGKLPPRIGLFYDTSTLWHNAWGEHLDLTID